MNSRSRRMRSYQGSWLILLGSSILGIMLSEYATMEDRENDPEKEGEKSPEQA